MNVNIKRENPSDPNRGIYIATREDGLTAEIARYPSGWRLTLSDSEWSLHPTKAEAVEAFTAANAHK